jgi:predicted acyltransferase
METNNERLLSIDALRGFDMFWIIGWGSIWHGLAKITDAPLATWWSFQMTHAEWDGFRFYDFIFPLFLFIAGISFPFSLDKSRQKGISNKSLYIKIIKRALILVLLGLVFNGFFRLEFERFRYTSVLARIGLAWMFAAFIFINTKRNARIIWCAGLLIFYWLMNALLQAPDYPDADRFSQEGNIVCYIDRTLGTTRGLSNAVGIPGIIPSISTALLGMLTGAFIKLSKEGLTQVKKVLYMTGAGVILILLGMLWDLVCPINKPLWSSSYVCLAGGMSLLFFALFYWIIDVRGYRRWTLFFTVIGVNSITFYMAQQIINFQFTANYFFSGLVKKFPADWSQFLNNFTLIVFVWLFLYFLYRQKIFLKV